MNSPSRRPLASFGLASVLCFAASLATAPADETIDFEPVAEFVRLPQGMELGKCSAVAISGTGDIYLFHRKKRPIICLNSDGQYLRSWGDDLVRTAHGLRIDGAGNVWVTDVERHQVFKFNSEGKLLLALGTGKPGTDTDQFNLPTDIAFGPQEAVYISDGYGNSRVMEFTSQGRFVTTWGKPGAGPGEFHLPHAILGDDRGRVLVGDRENNRIQIFDGQGKLLDLWDGFAPFGLAFDHERRLFVADGRANKVLQLDTKGRIVKSWGGRGTAPGQFQMPHALAFDAAGSLYVAEIDGMRLQKFRRKQGPHQASGRKPSRRAGSP
jgi:DNA-binding beta-propeller fold protein YncE